MLEGRWARWFSPGARWPKRQRPIKRSPLRVRRAYFRGRIVDALRLLGPGERVNLMELGPQVKADFSAADLAWLFGLAQRLARDGLIALQVTRASYAC